MRAEMTVGETALEDEVQGEADGRDFLYGTSGGQVWTTRRSKVTHEYSLHRHWQNSRPQTFIFGLTVVWPPQLGMKRG
jgi:hypothetical protein